MGKQTVQSLKGSISPVKSYFNEARGSPRFMALMSPTCSPCLAGAIAVREQILGTFREVGYPVILIWIPMMPEDSQSIIEEAAATFDLDGITQFADIDQSIGKLVADSLGGPNDIAWDTYLFYGSEERWTVTPPEPIEWVHQLGGYSWAIPERYRCGDDLTAELSRISKRVIHQHRDEVRTQ